MADVKWIKITTDIFDDEKILLIESMPSADSIIVIWFKLLTLAGKQNNDGVFMMNNRIAYTDEMLASIFRREINTVRFALRTFEQYGMIELIDNVITIPNWGKHQTLDAYEKKKKRDRERIARKRAEQRLKIEAPAALSPDTSPDVSPDKSPDVAFSERDRDIEREEKKKKKVKEDTLTLFNRLIPDFTLSDSLKAKMSEWITYKTERKEPYKETGLKSLLRQIENQAMTYGDPALIDLIDECMANNWKGIIFDRLGQKPGQAHPIPRQQPAKQSKAEELDGFYNMAAGWAAKGD